MNYQFEAIHDKPIINRSVQTALSCIRMQVTLTIVRYPAVFVPFAFLSMAIFRLPLWLNKKINFYKLMGCGKNGTFDKTPDLRQWALLAAHTQVEPENLYGKFIKRWFALCRCEVFTIYLEPREGHGKWDNKEPFGKLNISVLQNEPVATLTRATIRLNKLKYFWEKVAPVASNMKDAKGFLFSAGVGEIPWVKQATFSIWQTKEDMMQFAYKMKEHREVIKLTREQQWYSEEMFVRFSIIKSEGSLKGKDPLLTLKKVYEKY